MSSENFSDDVLTGWIASSNAKHRVITAIQTKTPTIEIHLISKYPHISE